MKFKVIRAHEGDKYYAIGDTREAKEKEVAHLVGKCLVPWPEKAAKPVKNKAAAPLANKGAK